MATIKIVLANSALSNSTADRDYVDEDKRKQCQIFGQYLKDLASGLKKGSLKYSFDHNDTSATGTVTCASVQAADTVTIAGTVFTSHASTNTAAFFALGASDTACAANLVLAINRHATVSKYVLASNVLGVVTITSIIKHELGNLVSVATSENTRLAKSGTALTAGASTAPSSFTF